MKNILITGGCGFVGGNLAIRFANLGYNVICFDNLARRGSESNLRRFKDYKNIEFIHGDIRNQEDFNHIKLKPHVVLECAAQTSAIDGYANPVYDLTNNTYGLINVLEYCRKIDAGLVFWTSNKSYSGDLCNSVPHIEHSTRLEWDVNSDFKLKGWSPKGFSEELDLNGGQHSIYGVSKLAGDLICQEWADTYDIPVIINRFSCIYGPNQFGKAEQGWIVWFMIAKLLGKPLTFFGFDGKQVRDCLYSEDMCDLIQKQVEMIGSHRGSFYNVGGGMKHTTSILELSNRLDEMLNIKSYVDISSEQRRADQKIYISDITKVSTDFDWTPKKNLVTGLIDTLAWVKTNKGLFS